MIFTVDGDHVRRRCDTGGIVAWSPRPSDELRRTAAAVRAGDPTAEGPFCPDSSSRRFPIMPIRGSSPSIAARAHVEEGFGGDGHLRQRSVGLAARRDSTPSRQVGPGLMRIGVGITTDKEDCARGGQAAARGEQTGRHALTARITDQSHVPYRL